VTPNLIGVVINALDIKARGYYYYYYQDHHQPTGEIPRPKNPDVNPETARPGLRRADS
jgi:hypothetical protein